MDIFIHVQRLKGKGNWTKQDPMRKGREKGKACDNSEENKNV